MALVKAATPYREQPTASTRSRRFSIFGATRAGLLFLGLFTAASLVSFLRTPSKVSVSCEPASQQCTVREPRVAYEPTPLVVDMKQALRVTYDAAPKAQTVTVTRATGTTRIDARQPLVGQFLVSSLDSFRRAPDQPLAASLDESSGVASAAFWSFVWIVGAIGATVERIVLIVKIEAAQLHLRAWRWGFASRPVVIPVDDAVRIEAQPSNAPGTRVMIRALHGGSATNLLARPASRSAAVYRLAADLDAFVHSPPE